jgi:hypothetical protein
MIEAYMLPGDISMYSFTMWYVISVLINMIQLFKYGRKLIREDGNVLYFRELIQIICLFVLFVTPIICFVVSAFVLYRYLVDMLIEFFMWLDKFEKTIIWNGNKK